MEVSSMLSSEPPARHSDSSKNSARAPQADHGGFASHRAHHREETKPRSLQNSSTLVRDSNSRSVDVMNPVSPTTLKQSTACPPKKVTFELLLDDTPKTKARIPMRVMINIHDATDSIVATVKNWWGIYESHGVTFQDIHGRNLIVQYENLVNDMVVYVRVVASQPYPSSAPPHTSQYGVMVPDQQRRLSLGEPFQMPPPYPTLAHTHTPSRPTSRLARKRSPSPQSSGRGRSISQHKRGSRSELRSRNSSTHGSHHDEGATGFSDSDGGQSSVTGSKKARSEQFVTAEISLENVLQDGRRNRPKFESSELPLFVPPQVPLATSQSSISPQRRTGEQSAPNPFVAPAQKLFNHNMPALVSPQWPHDSNYNYPRQQAPISLPAPNQNSRQLRDRSVARPSPQIRAPNTRQGLLPTPDPTIASCISDEDVARQLIALGDAPAFSMGRTSGSTLDDAFSGAADVASSVEATSDSDEYDDHEVDLSKLRYVNGGSVGLDRDYDQDLVKAEGYEGSDGPPEAKKIKTKQTVGSGRPKGTQSKSGSGAKNRNSLTGSKTPLAAGAVKSHNTGAGPVRKGSGSILNFQHQLAADEEDLSSKPRCQRCRKSKKGCDRQRPCQRCKDAGIGADGCLSEDEDNGRKGRYGRHMGVVVKKSAEQEDGADTSMSGPLPPLVAIGNEAGLEKSKKRKR